jgi:hypothetical protein
MNDESKDRRTFMKGAAVAAGLLGAAAVAPALGQNSRSSQGSDGNDPQAPPGLKTTPDMRYPLSFQKPATEGVRVMMDYLSALFNRDAKGMADSMHFPFGTYEGIDYRVVKTADDFLAHAPASINLTVNPERWTDHDSYLQPGAYDMFDGVQVINSSAIGCNLALSYDRYSADGHKLLRCEGIYWVTNNDGRWALQKASTIFTPAGMLGVEYPDALIAAKRLRIDHDLQFMHREALPESQPPLPGWEDALEAIPVDAPMVHSQQYQRYARMGASATGAMSEFKIKGVKSRVGGGGTDAPPNRDSLANVKKPLATPTNYPEYRDSFKVLGLGPWGWVYGTRPEAKVLHHTVDKVHLTTCAARFTAAGELINADSQLMVAIYQRGYWRFAGGMGSVMVHDRGNDRDKLNPNSKA